LAVFAFVLFVSSLAFACSLAKSSQVNKPFPIGDYRYTSYDNQGAKVVEGQISITSSEKQRIGAEEKIQLKGNWELKKVGNQEHIGLQEGKGDLIGTLDKDELYLDLNPNMNDANVLLQGTIEGKRFHGTWKFSGYAGAVIKGTFEATKQ